jgi:hypothetical protein
MLGLDHSDESSSYIAGVESRQDLAKGVVGDAAVDSEKGVVMLRNLIGSELDTAERGSPSDDAGHEAAEDGGQGIVDVGEIAGLREAVEVKVADTPLEALGSYRLTIHRDCPISIQWFGK